MEERKFIELTQRWYDILHHFLHEKKKIYHTTDYTHFVKKVLDYSPSIDFHCRDQNFSYGLQKFLNWANDKEFLLDVGHNLYGSFDFERLQKHFKFYHGYENLEYRYYKREIIYFAPKLMIDGEERYMSLRDFRDYGGNEYVIDLTTTIDEFKKKLNKFSKDVYGKSIEEVQKTINFEELNMSDEELYKNEVRLYERYNFRYDPKGRQECYEDPHFSNSSSSSEYHETLRMMTERRMTIG
jgi:hypothetical protein